MALSLMAFSALGQQVIIVPPKSDLELFLESQRIGHMRAREARLERERRQREARDRSESEKQAQSQQEAQLKPTPDKEREQALMEMASMLPGFSAVGDRVLALTEKLERKEATWKEYFLYLYVIAKVQSSEELIKKVAESVPPPTNPKP